MQLSSSLQPQVLQPFTPQPSEHLPQERAVKAPPTAGLSDLRASARRDADTPDGDLLGGVSGPVHPHRPSGPINTHPRCPGASQEQNPRDGRGPAAPAAVLQKASTCPRLLQPLRLQKHVSLPALKPGASLKSGSSLVPLANQPRQLPPPSRGLPSFHAEPQVHPRSPCGTLLLQPRRTCRPPRDTRGTGSSLD